jgi:YidC/Oxa1 family membrane protein insertase
MFAPFAWLLAAFYALWPSYGFAIIALTCTVLAVLLPLTLQQAKAMAAMQRLQPQLKRLRQEHKNDRQRLNQETVALYRRHGVNPAGGCLPMVVQLPVMIVMYRVIRGLTYHDPVTGDLAPQYLDHSSALYQSLQRSGGRMVSWTMDLSTSALSPHESLDMALPFFVLGALVLATSVWQQRLALSRVDPTPERTPGQTLMRLTPAFSGFLAISLPAGVAIYYLVSNIFRIGQQHLLHRLHPASSGVAQQREIDAPEASDRDGSPPPPPRRPSGANAARRRRSRKSAKRRKRRARRR